MCPTRGRRRRHAPDRYPCGTRSSCDAPQRATPRAWGDRSSVTRSTISRWPPNWCAPAGELAERMLRRGLDIEHKTSVSDVVSAADHAAEALIVAPAARRAPEDGIVGEEGTADSRAARTWYIDPVDGTYNFLSGCPSGVRRWPSPTRPATRSVPIYQPRTAELWLGGTDHPTTCNGVPVPPLASGRWPTSRSPATCTRRRCPTTRCGCRCCGVLQGAATVRMLGSGSSNSPPSRPDGSAPGSQQSTRCTGTGSRRCTRPGRRRRGRGGAGARASVARRREPPGGRRDRRPADQLARRPRAPAGRRRVRRPSARRTARPPIRRATCA